MLLNSFFSFLPRSQLAIDLGTANILIFTPEEGIILNEPTVVTLKPISATRSEVVAAGREAKNMLGRAPIGLRNIRPMRDGVISDFEATEYLLKTLIRRAVEEGKAKSSRLSKVVICVPSGATSVERHSIRGSAQAVGATEVYLLDEPVAAALGAKLPIDDYQASMVVDIGGGTTEVGILALGGVSYANSAKVAGDRFDEAIINYVRRNFGLLVGESTAERIKLEIGTAIPEQEAKTMEIHGRSMTEGVPRSMIINSNHVYEAISDVVTQLVRVISAALENAPPEMSSDLYQRGMTLTGGGSLLRNLPQRISQETKLGVQIAEDPLSCVANGCGIALSNLSKYRSLLS